MFRLASLGRDHDAGVVPEDIEFLLLGEELLRGGFDGGEVVEVEVQVRERAFGVWEGGLDGLDGLGGLGGGAGGEVDFGVVGVEDLSEFFADAAG